MIGQRLALLTAAFALYRSALALQHAAPPQELRGNYERDYDSEPAVSVELIQTGTIFGGRKLQDLGSSLLDLQRDAVCQERSHWLAQAPPAKVDAEERPFGSLLNGCTRIEQVCFHQGGSLVIMAPHNLTVGPDEIVHEFVQGATSQDQTFNMPGFHDALLGTQINIPTGKIRAKSELDPPELAQGWAARSEHLPVLFYPTWFDNIGENMDSNLLRFALYLVDNPQLKDRSLVIGTPDSMLLPRFWKLLGGLVYSVRGLYETCLHCDDQPATCFDHIWTCGERSLPKEESRLAIQEAGPAKVGKALAAMVQASCAALEDGAPSLAEVRSEEGEESVFRVWIDQRESYRKILNAKELVERCNAWVPEGYTRAECKLESITSTFDQACEINQYDVLVSIHGAGVANGLFVKPATGALVEVTTHGWGPPDGPAWGGTFYYRLFNSTPVRYFWYDALEADTEPSPVDDCKQHGGCNPDNAGAPLRDRSIQVKWLDEGPEAALAEGAADSPRIGAGRGGLRSILEAVAARGPDAHGRSVESLDVH